MVWIHGGAFYIGGANHEYRGPDYLMGHDVILVTVQYRLQALGIVEPRVVLLYEEKKNHFALCRYLQVS